MAAQPTQCQRGTLSTRGCGLGVQGAHEASEFQTEPLPRKRQIWFGSDIEQKKHGQMTSHADSWIYSDSLRWGHGANST